MVKKYLTPLQLAEKSDVSVQTVRKYIRRGWLKATTYFGRHGISEADAERFISESHPVGRRPGPFGPYKKN